VIRFESNHHWYGKDGKPQHDADLRVARKQFLYPSCTTIDRDVFKNDFLDKWKLEQVVIAASESFRQPHEQPEDYANRIYEQSLDKSKVASTFGKKIHKAIEKFPERPVEQELIPWIDKFGEWYEGVVESVLFRERTLLDHDIGVAGQCDCIAIGKGAFQGQVIIPDWKTQGVKKDKKGNKAPAFYDSWPRQLGYYAVAYAKESGLFPDLPTCISVIWDSTEASPPYVKVWGKEEIIDNYKDFVCGAYLWMSKRDYWPVGRWTPTFPFRMP
jgi:hypothetical protein